MKKIDRIAEAVMGWSIAIFLGCLVGCLALGLAYGIAGLIFG